MVTGGFNGKEDRKRRLRERRMRGKRGKGR